VILNPFDAYDFRKYFWDFWVTFTLHSSEGSIEYFMQRGNLIGSSMRRA
jgi:hypothetical protein